MPGLAKLVRTKNKMQITVEVVGGEGESGKIGGGGARGTVGGRRKGRMRDSQSGGNREKGEKFRNIA